jgi:ABC-2 type transport system permease protein
MKKFLAVFKARTMEFVRDRGTFFWNLIFPVLLVIGFSFAFNGEGESLFKVGILGAPEQTESSSLDPVRDFLSIPQIEFIYYPEDDRQELLGKLRGHQLDMILDAGEREYYINDQSTGGPVLRRLFLGQNRLDDTLPPSSFQAFSEQSVQGDAVRYVDWLVPGVLGMNMMFSCIFGVGFVLVRYRKNGVLKRLKATPVGALNFLSAQALSRLVIVIITSAVVYLGTNFFLDFRMEGSYLDLLLLFVLAIFSMISLGLIFAARLKSEELTSGLMNLILMPMLIFSGVFFSLEGTPEILQNIALIFPLTHFLQGARAIMIEGQGLLEILPNILALAGTSVLFLLISAFTFKWE